MPRRPSRPLPLAPLALALLVAAPALAQRPAPRPPAATQPHSAPASQPESAPASQAAVSVVARPDGVAGVTAAGATVWTLRHASLAPRPGGRLVGPVTAAGRTLYAVRADLLEVDRGRGVVVRRTRFPAPIAEIAPARDPADPRLGVTLEYPGEGAPAGSPDRVVVRYRLGDPAPGRVFWQGVAWMGAVADARELAPALKADDADPAKIPAEARDDAIYALREAAARDQTNPHYPALLGVLLQGAGKGAEASRAFAAAADTPGAHWADLLRVSSTLEDAGDREAARRAFARGLRGLECAGVRVERVRTAIALMILMPPPRRALGAALKAKDTARVDEIAARTARVFPQAEGSAYAWERLASWFGEQGKPDLAARWDDRARHGVKAYGTRPGRDLAGEVDTRLPFVLGALLGAVLIAFVAGLRRGGSAGGGLARVPFPGPAGLAAILLPLVAALALDLGTADRVAAIGRYASAPVGLFSDAADAPDVERWVTARLEPGARRDLVRAWVSEEAAATRAGGRSLLPPLALATVSDAIEDPGTFSTRLARTVSGSIAALVSMTDAGKGSPAALVKGLGATALAALVAFVLGFVLARLFPLTQVLAWLIPGGARSLGIPGGLVAALAAAGAFANWLPAALSRLAVPSYFKYYGLDSIAPPGGGVPDTAPPWVFAAFAIALGLQIFGITRDLKQSRARKAAAEPPAE